MFDDIIAVIIPLAAIGIIFAWVPLLNLICPPCGRSLVRQSDALKALSAMSSIRD